MRATVMHKAHDVRIENVPDAIIQNPTDAVIRVTAPASAAADLWPYNGGPNVGGRRWAMKGVSKLGFDLSDSVGSSDAQRACLRASGFRHGSPELGLRRTVKPRSRTAVRRRRRA